MKLGKKAGDGRYSFGRLEPGDYAICAWLDTSTAAQLEQAWEDADAAVRRFPLAAGDETEIVLTALP